jgi:pimeloyl-ACP methyl ester carboxylesterase
MKMGIVLYRSLLLAMLVLFDCAALGASRMPPVVFGSALPSNVSSVFVRFPQSNPSASQPLRVLVALHGIGGDGATFAGDLTTAADQNGWILVAPTIVYGDWMDPTQVAKEDAALITWLSGYLGQLQTLTDRPVDPQVLLLGFSRGAQLAHRFAEAYPDRVVAVAAVSAGSYTLPQTIATDGSPLPFPFGVGNFSATVGQPFQPAALRAVHFWVAVGGSDTNPADVPRQFDPYLGDDRLDRALAFVAALHTLDVSAQMAIFPNVPHALTADMQQAAVAFLADQSTLAA